jgi:DNA repair ATPase RecN
MANVYRLSLVKMIYAEHSNPSRTSRTKGEPYPRGFVELRAFEFVPRKPSPVDEQIEKNELMKAINTMQTLLLDHIFSSEKVRLGLQNYWSELLPKIGTMKTLIEIQQPTGRKIEIDGWEVAKISEEEIMQDDPEHLYFKNERVEGRKKLRLQIGRAYRYLAFFNPDGTLKEPTYDEIDIEKMIEVVLTAQARIDFLRSRLGVIVNVLKENTNRIEESIDLLEKVQRKLI